MDEAVKWIIGQSAIVCFLIGFIIWGIGEYRRQIKAKDELIRDMVNNLFDMLRRYDERETTVASKLAEFSRLIEHWFMK